MFVGPVHRFAYYGQKDVNGRPNGTFSSSRHAEDLSNICRDAPKAGLRYCSSVKGDDVKSALIYEKCLVTWDDLPQPRKLTEWRKLRHCYLLKLNGPISIKGIAERFVKQCTDEALKKDQFIRIVVAIGTIVGDIYGGGGQATASYMAALSHQVASDIVSCLSDTRKLTAFVPQQITTSVDPDIIHKTWWIKV